MSEQPQHSDGGSAEQSPSSPSSPADDFARQAEEPPMGLLAEFWDFLKHEKKWWLTPIIVVLLLLAIVAIVSPAAAPYLPFIYPLF